MTPIPAWHQGVSLRRALTRGRVCSLLVACALALAAACAADDAVGIVPTHVPTPLPSPVAPVTERPAESPPLEQLPTEAASTPTPTPIGQWAAAAALNEARAGHSAVLLLDGRVLVTGGYGSEGTLDSVEIYDHESDSWSAAAPMKTPRVNARAVVLGDGRVLVAGSANGLEDALASAEIYDPATDEWQPLPPMAVRRGFHTATLMADGRVLVAGGFDGEDWPDLMTDSAEIFDPETDSWEAIAPLPPDVLNRGTRALHGAVPFGDNGVLVVGGLGFGTGGLPDLNTTFAFDVTEGEWVERSPLLNARRGHTTTLLDDGRIVAVGGQGPQRLAEIYDPGEDIWLGGGANLQPRQNHQAVALPDQRVLITGGCGGSDVGQLASAEILDLESATWEAAAPMEDERNGHSMTVLPDGRVLVVGGTPGLCQLGFDGSGGFHRSVEIFDLGQR